LLGQLKRRRRRESSICRTKDEGGREGGKEKVSSDGRKADEGRRTNHICVLEDDVETVILEV